MSDESRDRLLPIPVYLDTNSLLDLLASLENGYSLIERHLEQVQTATSSATSGGTAAGGTFGIGSVLAFFRIAETGSESTAQERHSEKYHTLGSLLHKLRQRLVEENYLRFIESVDDWAASGPSDLIEFTGEFRTDPFLTSITNTRNALNLTKAARELGKSIPSASGNSTPSASPGKNRGGGKPTDPEVQMVDATLGFLDNLLADANVEQVDQYVVEILSDGQRLDSRVVLRLFPSFYRDRAGVELPGNVLRVLGKVVARVEATESIDLLRGTRLDGLAPDQLKPLWQGFAGLGSFVNMPPLEREVAGPALVVIPVAIFV